MSKHLNKNKNLNYLIGTLSEVSTSFPRTLITSKNCL